MASLKGRVAGLCENCWAGKVQVARGLLLGGSAPPQVRFLPLRQPVLLYAVLVDPYTYFLVLYLCCTTPFPAH